jgi:hypothetical protein
MVETKKNTNGIVGFMRFNILFFKGLVLEQPNRNRRRFSLGNGLPKNIYLKQRSGLEDKLSGNSCCAYFLIKIKSQTP